MLGFNRPPMGNRGQRTDGCYRLAKSIYMKKSRMQHWKKGKTRSIVTMAYDTLGIDPAVVCPSWSIYVLLNASIRPLYASCTSFFLYFFGSPPQFISSKTWIERDFHIELQVSSWSMVTLYLTTCMWCGRIYKFYPCVNCLVRMDMYMV